MKNLIFLKTTIDVSFDYLHKHNMTSPLSMKKTIKVLLLDPLPIGTDNAFSTPLTDNLYSVDSFFEDLTEAELVKKVQEYNIICLRFVRFC